MTKYRQIHTRIWKDDWFLELNPSAKLLYIYLFSNERASISGIYEISERVIAFETDLSKQEIRECIDTLSELGKVVYIDGVLFIPALRKYYDNGSPKVKSAIDKDFRAVQEGDCKDLYRERYGIDRVSETENTVGIGTFSSSSSISSGISSSEAAAVFDSFAQLCGHGGITKPVADEIGAFIDEVGAPMVIEAIDEAATHNGRSWAYVRKILANWRDNGKGAGKKATKPDVSILLAALQKPYKEARAELEAAGAWGYVERLGRWEDLKRKPQKDLEFAWRAA